MLVSVMILWTSGIVVAKTIGDTISVLEFSLWRWVFAAAFLFPFSFRGLNKNRCQIRKKKWKIFLLGVFLAGGSSLLVWSVQKTSVMNAALLSATQPIVTVGLFWILLSQKLRKIQLGGIFIASLGVIFIVTRMDVTVLLELSFNKGDLFVVSAVFFYSLYTIYLNRWLPEFPPTTTMFLTAIGAILALVPIVMMMDDLTFAPFDSAVVKALIYMAIVPTAVATTMWNVAVGIVGPNKGSAFINLMPVLGGIASILIFNEPLKMYHVLGTLLTCFGLTLVLKDQNESVTQHNAEKSA